VAYQHRYLDGSPLALPIGKVVCIGRNYLDHIRELNNAVPETPILFMKPATALAGLDEAIRLPAGRGECHHEVELAVLVDRELRNADADTARAAVAGYGIALDLTLRDLQNDLKKKGHPWETAKAFDGACPLSPFLQPEALPEPQATELALRVNGEVASAGQHPPDDGRWHFRTNGLHLHPLHPATGRRGTDRHAIRRWLARLRRRVDAQPGRHDFSARVA
jgi:2-keto-4-pentenoate hydratase/2-oxohepta-3-ene-1,7-dioic acid hydratase in catechol pathway